MKKAIVIGVLLLSLVLYVYFTEILPARSVSPTIRGSGSIEATEIMISPKVTGRIISEAVVEGDEVKQGDLLVTIDCGELDVAKSQALAQVDTAGAAVAQAESQTAQARALHRQAVLQIKPLIVMRDQVERDFKRSQSLYDQKSIPLNRFEQARSAYQEAQDRVTAAQSAAEVAKRQIASAQKAVEVARANLATARTGVEMADQRLSECRLSAPATGRISTIFYEVGEMAMPGASLLKLYKMDDVFVWVYVPNHDVGRVRLNQNVNIVADTYPGITFKGNVVRINEEAEFTPKSVQTKEDRTRLVFGVKVALDNSDRKLLPGMPVEATFEDTAKKGE